MATPSEVITDITIKNYERDALESAFEHKPSASLIKEKGNWEKKSGGEALYQPIDVANYVAYDVDEYEDISSKYVPTRLHTKAELDWGQKSAFDALSKLSMKKNNGEEALVKFRDVNIPRMFRSVLSQGTNSLNYSFFYGTSSGSGLPTIGLAEFMVFDTATTSDKDGTVTAGTTYAGLSCVTNGLASVVENADDDAWTPKGTNTNYDWDGDSTVEADLQVSNWRQIIDHTQINLSKDPSDKMLRPDIVICNQTYYNVGRNYIGDKQNIFIERPGVPENGAGKWALGTSCERFFDNGLWITWDADIATDRAYMLNFDMIGYCYLDPGPRVSGDKYDGDTSGSGKDEQDPGIFDTEVDYNADRLGIKIATTVSGQYRFHPRYQALITKLT